MTTHAVSSKKIVYILNDGQDCFKFQIESYTSGKYQVRAEALPLASAEKPSAEVIEQIIDASSTTTTSYLALSEGHLVASDVAGDWLISVKRVQFQTNSGTSGTGSSGVHNTGLTDFDAVTSCVGFDFTADALLPASGAPGSQPYSGSEILNAWYNYDMSTHTVTSKQDVYAITDGKQCLKFQITGYEGGRFSVRYSVID